MISGVARRGVIPRERLRKDSNLVPTFRKVLWRDPMYDKCREGSVQIVVNHTIVQIMDYSSDSL